MNVASTSIPAEQLKASEAGPLHGRLRHLLDERGAPIFQASLQDPVYNRVLETQSAVLERLENTLGVKPTKGRHTDADGVLTVDSLEPGRAAFLLRTYSSPATITTSQASPHLPHMCQSFSRFSMPNGATFMYSKTTACPPDEWPTPQLDIEMGSFGPDLLCFVGMAPRASITTDLKYLNRYYNQPPPTAPTASTNGGQEASQPQLLSFKQLDAELRAGGSGVTLTPSISPSLWIRSCATTALFFSVPWATATADPLVMDEVRRYVLAMTDTWLGHVAADAEAGGAAAAAADPWVKEQWRRTGEFMRNYVRHDPMTPLLVPLLGQDAVTRMIETVAGER